MIKKFTISRDDSIYEAFPDVTLTREGKLICVFAECTHHSDRSYTRLMLADSMDRGRTWTPKRPLTEGTNGKPYWNCGRIMQLRDGRIAILADLINEDHESRGENFLFFSSDEGATWSDPLKTPAEGIVPDKLLELASGRWILSCHDHYDGDEQLAQRLWYSDDHGGTWSGPVTVAEKVGLHLCEVSILEIGETLVAFLRENSFQGWDCYKTLSNDRGETWGDPIRFPIPACHRPVSGFLNDGRIMITHRFMQGGNGWVGWWTQNLFAALTDRESALAPTREKARTRIMPIDFDRSPESDTAYSGWVQFEDGEIYVVNYILDDAPKGQIRGYAFRIEDLILE